MDNKRSIFVILALIVALLTLVSCDALTSPTSGDGLLLPMATDLSASGVCVECAQATVAAALTQVQNNADAQAAATAEVMRANAQATLDSVSSTLSAAQTQEQNNANIVAAQVAATAEIIRANAQATLVAAGSTQGAAQTQDAIRQTQVQFSLQVTADLATQNAVATLNQQNNNSLAAGTQTQVANLIATQTQAAVATTQWYADQARQRNEQRQVPLNFLWLWCLPVFIVVFAGLSLWGFWRWLKIREARQRMVTQPADPLIIEHEPLPSSEPVNNQYPLTKPTDHVRWWLEEVKRKLITSKKDDDDNPGN